MVDKPEGLPVIAAGGSRSKSLIDLVTELLKRGNPRARAAVVHRLDRDTSGVMVLACGPWAKKALMDSWAESARDRRYLALVEGEPETEEGVLDSWLVEAGPSRMRVGRPGERGALRARGSWRLLGRGGGYALLEVALETGRKHQIRVQLAALGHPVAGDERYGSRRDPGGRLMLHASLLELVHPRSGEILRFESPPPPSFRAALGQGRSSAGRVAPAAKPGFGPPAGGWGMVADPAHGSQGKPGPGPDKKAGPGPRGKRGSGGKGGPGPYEKPGLARKPTAPARPGSRREAGRGQRPPEAEGPRPSRRGPARRDRGRSSS